MSNRKKTNVEKTRKKDKHVDESTEESEITRDSILGAMLDTPPKTHDEMREKKT